MPTSRNSPTARETDTTDVPQDVHPETQDVSGDLAKQFPGPVDEKSGDEVLQEEQDEEKGGSGETWARYKTSANHMRGFTVKDQIEIGVPEDRVVNNVDKAQPRTLESPLEPGLWFTLQNRFRANVSDVHPVLREYLQEDEEFDVTTY